MNGRLARWLWSLAYRPAPRRGACLVIVRHHRSYRPDETPLYRIGVGAHVLSAQLEMMERAGLEPMTVSEGLAWLATAREGRRVALTFDDGYADNVHLALPLLRARGMRATFFLTAGLIEERRAPWWDVLVHLLERTRARTLAGVDGLRGPLPLENRAGRARALRALLPLLRLPPDAQQARLRDLAGRLGVSDEPPCELATWEEARALVEAGMEVGAHTLRHPFLSLCDPDLQQAEIAGSVALVAERLGVRPAGLAYPGGDYDATCLAAACRAGLAWAVGTRRADNTAASPRFELARRSLSDGACLSPRGTFSRRLALAELYGAFDRARSLEAVR